MKQKIITISVSIIILSIAFFGACKDEELPEVTGNNKIELTITEDSTSYVFAEITCALSELPKFAVEQHGFCWDTIASINIEKQSNSFGVLNSQNFTENAEALLPNKTYYVKAYIQNGDVVIYSNELSIETLDARPIVTTNDIINIKGNSAESGGSVNAFEELFPITQRGICWAKTNTPTITDSLTTNGTGNGAYTSEMKNLEVGINYYVRAYAVNSEGISYGDGKTFSTLDGIPYLTTDSITNITATSATLYGNIIENDGLEILEKGFCWNTSTNPTIENNFQIVAGNTLGNFNGEATGLPVNTTFYVKAYIKNSEGTFYSNEISFTTFDGLPSGLTSTAISDITATTATSGGNITDDGGFAVTSRGVCWSTSTNPVITDAHTTDGTGTGSFTSSLTGLNVNTTYYVRSYATNETGTIYGNEISFTTLDGLPNGLTTTAISDITATTATSGGNITDDGGFVITARGVCWSTSSNPTIADVHTTDGTGTGSFTSNLTGLDVNTTYYVRSYATNETGTVYGNEISFTTLDGLPNGLTTTAISDITATTATSGGNITDDGGFEITARGVCWSTSSNPTIADAHTTDGTGIGSFTSSLTGLTEWTNYYVRAYATNSAGTSYGDEKNFTTIGAPVTDYDGNVYETVKIGDQVWMAENLKTTHYANGTAITLVEDGTAWDALLSTDKAYCYYNNSSANGNTYGALYTWAAAMNGASSSSANPSGVQGACPDGWHLPSDSEWTELTNYLSNNGYSGTEGTALKSTSGWYNDGNGTDNYGFTALPAGRRTDYGSFSYLNSQAHFWISTENSSTWAYYQNLEYENSAVVHGLTSKNFGFSIRCLKD